MQPRRDLPSGTVTFLFTDVEGSTELLHRVGPEPYARALSEHRRAVREAFARHGGVEVDTQGDAFFVAFPTAPGALEAARKAQQALARGPISIRIGVHTGTPLLTDEGYVGTDVHRAARIAAAGHGGQVLVSAATVSLAGDAAGALTDLGEHRLKDLSAPERIWQLGEGGFPPLKSLYRTNLPVPATALVGRERELEQVRALLDNTRLLTLTGPGGTGKTRLALQGAADAADEYPDGVFWVPLAPLRDATLVCDAAAQAVGATEDLAEHIGAKRLLLLLDNFEHVVGAAGDVADLLAACPNLDVLVTSRELLRLPGEQAYPVPPLEPAESTELFVARARAVTPDFEPDEAVSELCERLEHLPLALELAAARVRILAPRQLLERLVQRLDLLKAGRGVDPRQQTLRATIEWSHDLLDEEERRLFARLGVFAGGCTLEAAEAVCDADLDVLQSLVDKSLVRLRDEGRFWMLGTIREYAVERLDASGEAGELRRRHAEHFVALAEEAEPDVLGVSPRDALDRLEREHDNIRAALDCLDEARETELAFRLAGAIWEFWCLRGHVVEGWRRLEQLLALDERPTLARAKALTGAAHLAPQVDAGAELHRSRAEQALALYRALGDAWGAAFGEFQYAGVLTEEGDFESARPLFEASVQRLRAVGDEHRALQATRAVAWCNLELGDIERAKQLYEEFRDGAVAAGDDTLHARALGVLSQFRSGEGDHDEALAMLGEAYRLDRGVADPANLAEDLVRFAVVLAAANRAADAARMLGRADAIHDELGVKLPPWLAQMRNDATEGARSAVGEAAYEQAWEQGRTLTTDDAIALALSPARSPVATTEP